jgi:hypothetical protein
LRKGRVRYFEGQTTLSSKTGTSTTKADFVDAPDDCRLIGMFMQAVAGTHGSAFHGLEVGRDLAELFPELSCRLRIASLLLELSAKPLLPSVCFLLAVRF